jgi:2-polyprenyl-3-methyl-5-hydroxy-6-metoxy-1,4-benzoquinol methylase
VINGGGALLPQVIERVTASDEKFGGRLKKRVEAGDFFFHERAEDFFDRYRRFIESRGRTFEFGIDCFLRLHHSLPELRADFLRSGRYRNSSFEEVNRAVYGNPEIMQYHMHGLAFAQFLWPEQYHRFRFFADQLSHYRGARRYLEVGGGHALYISEAMRVLPEAAFDLVDISPTSLEMSREIVPGAGVNFHLMNIFDFPDESVYDFITMGEVIEHVEQPRQLLTKVRSLLTPEGAAYITTPANAPMIDHIHLFSNAREIRQMLTECGFRIEHETQAFAVEVREEVGEKMKLPLMYAALVRRA